MPQRIFPACIATLMLAACTGVQTTNPGATGVDRKQLMLIPEEEVEQASAEAYRQQVEQARAANALNSDAQLSARVQAIVKRLVLQTSTFRADAPRWDWETNVQTEDEVNAYAMPGGKVMVYSGLITKLQATDAELAAVLGHEMAHALREHTRERVSRQYAEQLALAGVAAATGAGPQLVELAKQVTDVALILPHSRKQEAEADIVGLELMARAGYDPQAAISLWQKMEKVGGGGPQFLSTHPSGKDRIAELQANLSKVMPLYRVAAR
jgi:predicted Zn-dependent protease